MHVIFQIVEKLYKKRESRVGISIIADTFCFAISIENSVLLNCAHFVQHVAVFDQKTTSFMH